jgi:hypothetical protein
VNKAFDFGNVDLYDGRPEGFDVYSWSPGEPGSTVPATQVHLHGLCQMGRIIWRFKGPGSLDRLIDALIEHREYVWGKR